MQQEGVSSLVNVAMRAGALGYTRILMGYMRTDMARNKIARKFLAESHNDNDTLIMLDDDHAHPIDVLERLVAADKGTVGVLAFLRGAPYNPCAFIRDDHGSLHPLAEWDGGIMPVSSLRHAALAIQ